MRKGWLRSTCRSWLLFLQKLALCDADLSNHKLAGEHATFFHGNSPRGNIAFQSPLFLDRYYLGSDLSRHLPFNLDSFGTDSAETMNVGFALNNDMPATDPAGDLA